MRCFQHPQTDAAGVCRGCGKGVCLEPCARDLAAGLACSDACAERITRYEALKDKATATYRTARGNVWMGPAYLGAMGLLFLAYGLWRDRDPLNFLTAMGGLFVLFALVLYLRNRRWARELEATP